METGGKKRKKERERKEKERRGRFRFLEERDKRAVPKQRVESSLLFIITYVWD